MNRKWILRLIALIFAIVPRVSAGGGAADNQTPGLSSYPSAVANAQHAAEAADQELNAVYKELRNICTPAEQAELKKAELAWIKRKDTEAAAAREACPGDANAKQIAYYGSLAKLSKSRCSELKSLLSAKANGGDEKAKTALARLNAPSPQTATTEAKRDPTTNSASLEFVSSFGGRITGWIQDGHVIYLMQGSVLRAIDISEPANPRERGRLNVCKVITDFEYNPPGLYLATQEFGQSVGDFCLVDLTDPWNPKEVSTDVGMWCTKRTNISLEGKYLSVQLNVYDVSDPLHPRHVGNLNHFEFPEPEKDPVVPSFVVSKQEDPRATPPELRPWTGLADAQRITIKDGIAYLVNGPELALIDTRDPARPRRAGHLRLPADGLAISMGSDDLVLVSDSNRGLNVIATNGATTPTLRTRLELPASGQRIALASNVACVAMGTPTGEDESTGVSGTTGLQLVDLRNPDHPRLAGVYETDCHDVVTSGSLAYLASGNLVVVDVSNPDRPLLIGKSTLQNPMQRSLNQPSDSSGSSEKRGADFDINLSGNQAVAMGPMTSQDAKGYSYGEINFFDVADPRSPTWKGGESGDECEYYGVRVFGEMVYAFGQSNSTMDRARILNLNPLGNARLEDGIAGTQCFENLNDVIVVGDLIYVADGGQGLVILRNKKLARP